MINGANLVMKTKKLRIVNIIKKTNAKFFKDLKVGDIIQLESTVDASGRTTKGCRPKDIYIKKLEIADNSINEIDYVSKTFNELSKIICLFDFEEI